MANLIEHRENLLFAIDHITDAAEYCDAAGEANVADTLRDIIRELAGVASTIQDGMYRRDEADRRALRREYEVAL